MNRERAALRDLAFCDLGNGKRDRGHQVGCFLTITIWMTSWPILNMTGVGGEPGVSLLTLEKLIFASASRDVVDFGRRSSDDEMYSLNSCRLEGNMILLAILPVN